MRVKNQKLYFSFENDTLFLEIEKIKTKTFIAKDSFDSLFK